MPSWRRSVAGPPTCRFTTSTCPPIRAAPHVLRVGYVPAAMGSSPAPSSASTRAGGGRGRLLGAPTRTCWTPATTSTTSHLPAHVVVMWTLACMPWRPSTSRAQAYAPSRAPPRFSRPSSHARLRGGAMAAGSGERVLQAPLAAHLPVISHGRGRHRRTCGRVHPCRAGCRTRGIWRRRLRHRRRRRRAAAPLRRRR